MSLRRWSLACVAAALAVAMSGCIGLVAQPMPRRLTVEEQERVDSEWASVVANAADRTTLLDAITLGALWHEGIDSVEFVGIKRVGDVSVVLQTKYERLDPDGDSFSVFFYDENNRLLRTESYTREDLDEQMEIMFGNCDAPVDKSGLPMQMTTEEAAARQARCQERDARMARLGAVFPSPPPDDDSHADEPGEDGQPSQSAPNPVK